MATLTGDRLSKNYRFTVDSLDDDRLIELRQIIAKRNLRRKQKLRVVPIKRGDQERDIYVYYR